MSRYRLRNPQGQIVEFTDVKTFAEANSLHPLAVFDLIGYKGHGKDEFRPPRCRKKHGWTAPDYDAYWQIRTKTRKLKRSQRHKDLQAAKIALAT